MESGVSSASAQVPPNPVRLLSDPDDPCTRRLQVLSSDRVGLLFKLCELITSHGIDICSAEISTVDGVVHNIFELRTARLSDFDDAHEWCKELESFLLKDRTCGASALEESIVAASKHLVVNPDLVCVVSFGEIADHDGPPGELRYALELNGINQAGLLTYTALVLYRSGFSVIAARISTFEGHISDRFELSTTSAESEHLLRSYLDMPMLQSHKENVSLPFHATRSEGNFQALMQLWDNQVRASTPSPSGTSTPRRIPSVQESLDECAGTKSPGRSIDVEQASSDGGMVWKRVSGSDQGAQSRRPSQGPPPLPPKAGQDGARRLSVHFANGDVYNGSVIEFQSGEKRHGLGTYIYSPGSHQLYQQYRGQWREDHKQGYGVLFYRNGGVYVGHWDNNQRQGLGVLLDNADENDRTAMPSFRYEGQWQEDEPHGLGTEESESAPSYFGQFVRGKRHGRGVQLSRAKAGIAGCEAVDRFGRLVPLLDALESEIHANRQPPPIPSFPSRSPPDADGLPGAAAPAAAPWVADGGPRERARVPRQVSYDPICNTSGSSSSKTHSPQSFRAQGCGSPADSVATPMVGGTSRGAAPAGHDGARQGRDDRFGAAPAPSDSVQTPAELLGGERSEPGGTGTAAARQDGCSSASGGAGRTRNLAQKSRKPGGPVALNSPRGGSSPLSPRQGAHLGGGGGSVVFSLHEENDLLSPRQTTPFDAPKARREGLGLGHAAGAASSGSGAAAPRQRGRPGDWWHGLAGPAGGGAEAAEAEAVLTSEAGFTRSVSSPAPSPPPPAPGEDPQEPQGGLVPEAACAAEVPEPSTPRRGTSHRAAAPHVVTPPRSQAKPSGRPRKVLRTPLLWSEDELAAFVACLGIGPEVSARVKQRKIKGTQHLLEMSNSELRREFGLASPVERLVVRQSLRRLLSMDRWENSVRGHKAGDILSDSVLGRFILPLEELTLVTKISQGGYGTVYRGVLTPSVDRAGGTMTAHRTHLVAVKEMKGERNVRLSELLKEACVMASLHHPNICTFIGVCADASARKHFIVSELMDCSLFDLIHQPYKLRWHGELTVLKVLELSKGICAGMVYMHVGNLVHADLKSSNILIDYSSSASLVPRICDFGHAAVRVVPTPHHRCGTPHWAAPEVLRGEALGPAADVYSFGVIVWEMLAQKLPHKGLSFGQVLASVGWAGWTPDLALLPAVPRQLLQVLRECLSFSPPDRPKGTSVQLLLRKIPRRARLKSLKMLASFLS